MTTTSPTSAPSASASLRVDFSGRVAVVTGGANGIGQGIALALNVPFSTILTSALRR